MNKKFCLYLLILVSFANAQQNPKEEKLKNSSYNINAESPIFIKLNKLFLNSCPQQIHVILTNETISKFDSSTSTVFINSKANEIEADLVHEAAHLCLEKLTKGFSNTEPFRFFDEGLANIIEAEWNSKKDDYKKKALIFASQEARSGNISFENIQKWNQYFGRPPRANWNAYLVGSSFIFFIQETFSDSKLNHFFKTISENGNLEKSLLTVFGLTNIEFEKKWLHYLSKIEIPPPPKIVQLLPAHLENGVSLTTSELTIEFDQPMNKKISIGTKCDDGVCHTNAFWKSEKVLVIKVQGKLLPSHEYSLSLGTIHGLLQSAVGVDLPLTPWKFTTSK